MAISAVATFHLRDDRQSEPVENLKALKRLVEREGGTFRFHRRIFVGGKINDFDEVQIIGAFREVEEERAKTRVKKAWRVWLECLRFALPYLAFYSERYFDIESIANQSRNESPSAREEALPAHLTLLMKESPSGHRSKCSAREKWRS